MPRSVVAHRYWGSPGGGQLVCVSAAVALDKAGLPPILTGTFKFDPSRYVDWYGIDISRYPTITLMPYNVKAFGLWTRLYMWRPAEKAIKKFSASLMFIDDETYKPLVRYRSKGLKITEYIHFPLEVIVDKRFKGTGLAYGEDPYIMERYGKFPLNIYWKIFTALLPKYLRENPFTAADLVLTNSRWTARVAEMVYGEKPEVLNPPLPPNVHVQETPTPFEQRSPFVVMLGRFSEEKRYHWVVAELMPMLIKEVPEVKLVIFGGATTRTQMGYVNKVVNIAKKNNINVKLIEKGNILENIDDKHNVYMRLNAPRSEINSFMDRARVFLHATINEHWGIAVAEAMARGLPVVVHRSGGAWSDLLEEGKNGLGYETAEETVAAVAKMITDKVAWNYYSANSLKRIKDVTFEAFEDKFISIVKKLSI
jgi:glycosyltransferase involved in cell wall biosynthesis